MNTTQDIETYKALIKSGTVVTDAAYKDPMWKQAVIQLASDGWTHLPHGINGEDGLTFDGFTLTPSAKAIKRELMRGAAYVEREKDVMLIPVGTSCHPYVFGDAQDELIEAGWIVVKDQTREAQYMMIPPLQ